MQTESSSPSGSMLAMYRFNGRTRATTASLLRERRNGISPSGMAMLARYAVRPALPLQLVAWAA